MRHITEMGTQMIDGHETLSRPWVVQKHSSIQEIGKRLKVIIPDVGQTKQHLGLAGASIS